MKTLYIHRHAKSDWSSGATNDHDRPLNERGKKDAPFMARQFANEKPSIDLLLSSTAERAKTTMEYYKKALGSNEEAVRLERKLYHADVSSIMIILEELDDDLDTVMIFGHNPTFSELCHYLDNSFRDYLATCARVKIELDIAEWIEIHRNCGRCIEHIYPKKFLP